MMETIRERLLQQGEELVQALITWTPRVLLGLLLLIVALLAAKIIEKLTRVVLRRVRVDSLVQHVGIDQVLQKMGLRQSLEKFVPRVVYFLLLFLFARSGAEALGMGAISSASGPFLPTFRTSSQPR